MKIQIDTAIPRDLMAVSIQLDSGILILIDEDTITVNGNLMTIKALAEPADGD